jgi:transposase
VSASEAINYRYSKKRSPALARLRDERSRSTAEAQDLESALQLLVRELAPTLFAEPGVGVISAPQTAHRLLTPGRFRSEAALASLAGAAPSPARRVRKLGRDRLARAARPSSRKWTCQSSRRTRQCGRRLNRQ